jgi:hypothetical protein
MTNFGTGEKLWHRVQTLAQGSNFGKIINYKGTSFGRKGQIWETDE